MSWNEVCCHSLASQPRLFVVPVSKNPHLKFETIHQLNINSLAYAELYLTLAHLFRRFDLELYQTTPEDMDWKDVSVPRMKGHLKVMIRQAKD